MLDDRDNRILLLMQDKNLSYNEAVKALEEQPVSSLDIANKCGFGLEDLINITKS